MEGPKGTSKKARCVVSISEMGKDCAVGEGSSRVGSSTKFPYSLFYGVSPKETEVDAAATSDPLLPFEKTIAVIWDSVESLDVFKLYPQKPHFRTLEYKHEDHREGIALEQMITFSNIVRNIEEKYEDMSKRSIESCLKKLFELEENGFDVTIFCACLNDLLLKKDKKDAVENDLKE